MVRRGYRVTVFGTSKHPIEFSENGIDFKFVKEYFKKYKVKDLLRSITGKISFLSEAHLQFFVDEKKYMVDELNAFLHDKNIKPDVIETHDWEGVSLFLDRLNVPYVVRCHGSWTVLEGEFGYQNVAVGKKYCEKLAFQKSKNNIVISEFSKKINIKYFDINSPCLIYNGIDTQFFKPDIDTGKLPGSVFYFGNTSTEKGADTALKAFKKIREAISYATLHFVGNPQDFPSRLSEFLDEKDQPFVVFHGQKRAYEIKELLAKAELLLFPSKGENFSLSLLEAMGMAKVVVCNAIPAFTEIIKNGENGFTFSMETRDSLKNVLDLLDKNQLRQMGYKAEKLFSNNFQAEEMLTRTIKSYCR